MHLPSLPPPPDRTLSHEAHCRQDGRHQGPRRPSTGRRKRRSARPLCHSLRMAAAAATLIASAIACMPPPQGGIHARMRWSETGGLVVLDVPPGPSEQAGLKTGDRILAIDGVPTRTLAMREAVNRLRGPVGSTVELKVLRQHETPHRVTVSRAPYVGHIRP